MDEPYLDDARVTVWHADCLDVLRRMPDESVHAVVTDPPYGLSDHSPAEIIQALTAWAAGDREHVPDGKGFMGREWDRFVPPPAVWDECLRVLTPGGHLLAFAGSRTGDLMGISIRMAGFEIRDSIAWLNAQGFAKGRNLGLALGEQWEGWNTTLKPAQEPIVVARKPPRGTVTDTVREHGTGGLNVAGCRVGDEQRINAPAQNGLDGTTVYAGGWSPDAEARETVGRWPTNAVFTHAIDCHDDACVPGCPIRQLDADAGHRTSGSRRAGEHVLMGYQGAAAAPMPAVHGDSGPASRYFPAFLWSPKAPTSERPEADGDEHESVKPLDLMRWIVRLVTPLGGTVLEPFGGSGTTAEACILEGARCVLIERDPKYLPLIYRRVVPYRSPAVLARALGRGVTPPRRAAKARPADADVLFDVGG
jgi:DNA modification methylase